MGITIDEIRQMLRSGQIEVDLSNPESTIKVKQSNNFQSNCSIYVGWDVAKANQIDDIWSEYRYKLLEHIHSQDYSDQELLRIENELQFGDGHWDWFNKSICYKSEEYEWFYLYFDGKPQAVCLIYHPKTSVFSGENIFYIEYIAVAPWNRKNPMEVKLFSGLGQIFIQFISNYACEKLGLSQGFSLHSLPGAKSFYLSIGMRNVPNLSKGSLEFFEMSKENTFNFMGVS